MSRWQRAFDVQRMQGAMQAMRESCKVMTAALDRAGKHIDDAWIDRLSAAHSRQSEAIHATAMILDCIEKKRWYLRVLARPTLRLTLPREPAGTHRPFGLTSHFHLSAG